MVLLTYNLAPVASGLSALVERVPDDAFYYLVLAKNFAASGWWTFDGTHAASGFHILFGYLMAALYWLWPAIPLETVYLVVVIANTLLIAGAIYLLARVNDELGQGAGNIALVLVAISAVGIRLAGFPMEAALVVFFSAVAFHLAVTGRGSVGLAGIVGILGVLSRSDWGAMPLALLAGVAIEMWLAGRFEMRRLKLPLALLAGAVVGEVIVALHTFAFTGGLVQKSGSIKHHWASVQGLSPLSGIARVVELSGPGGLPRGVTLAGLAVAGVALVWSREGRQALLGRAAIAALLVVFGYTLVYMFNGSVQYWYAANYFAAVAVLLSMLFARLPERLSALGPAAIAVWLAGAAYQYAHPPWTWAPAMVEAGRALKANPALSPVGSWNAGIISFFAERPVINLDGLVNDAVHPHITGGTLARFVDEADIRYLADFADIFSDAGGRRGGYADGRLRACVRPLRTFRPERAFADTPLTLYDVDQSCLEARSNSGTSR